MPAVGEVGFGLLVVETHDLLCPELRRHALEPAARQGSALTFYSTFWVSAEFSSGQGAEKIAVKSAVWPIIPFSGTQLAQSRPGLGTKTALFCEFV